MDKTTPLRVAAAISALVALPAAAAEPASVSVPQAQSYAELLDPIPNAAERLRLADTQEEPRARLIEAQYYPSPADHHHHHHHWRRHRRHYHHHHHHHHHHSNY
ncbi:MAG: hypothetical protein JWO83_4394 [Caulobacteraceae bacterium]|nr:hypothetical protein [Caulobacteraceae bacterium]